jgi:hypothetical protein
METRQRAEGAKSNAVHDSVAMSEGKLTLSSMSFKRFNCSSSWRDMVLNCFVRIVNDNYIYCL